MEYFIFVSLIIVAALIGHNLSKTSDYNRIERVINSEGGQLITADLKPFGYGWAGDKHNRIYKIRYLDKEKNEREAYVKTSTLSGVYFSQDKLVKKANYTKERIIEELNNA